MAIVVLEAMASGLPVVTTPNGQGDIVRDGLDGFLIPPRNVEAILERLEILRHEPELRALMGCNARERAMMFTWDIYREKAVCHVKSWLKDTNKH
jgi:glycosyltransferase involved in cell wall biosynthesis